MVTAAASARPIVRLSTEEAYEKWAEVYDHDGNILQLHDDHAFDSNMPKLLSLRPPKILLDLGCGTGRNTLKLYSKISPNSTLIALDMSAAMMSKAQSLLAASSDRTRNITLKWVLHNINTSTSLPAEISEVPGGVDAVVSTLVLEHLYLDKFFSFVTASLRRGGWLYLTSMHPEQGAISQAGFVGQDEEGREVKIQGMSFNHKIDDILDAAGRVGLKLIGSVESRGVESEEHAERLGKRAFKWIGVKMHVAMTFIRE